jgi:hypothetical protein
LHRALPPEACRTIATNELPRGSAACELAHSPTND